MEINDECKTKEQLIAELNSLKKRVEQLEKSEALSKEIEERLAITLRSIREGVISINNTGKIILVNEAAEHLIGQTKAQMIGKPIDEVFCIVNEDNRIPCENLAKQLVTKETCELPRNAILLSQDGSEKIIAYNTYPMRNQSDDIIGLLLLFWNITRQRQLEEELLKAQKLESIALLASGIAHDFSNILAIICGNLTMGKMYCKSDTETYHRLIEAEKACYLAKELTKQLSTFAKGEVPMKEVISLDEILLESISLFFRDSKIKCNFSIPGNLWQVEADRMQISQVIHNLLINASQAMPEGGIIEVKAKNIKVKPSDHLPIIKGKYVHISVTDFGKGIAKKDLLKIFDPYFTTKCQGRGLGLTIIYSIVARHNGHVCAESQLGESTTFHVYLPAAPENLIH
ncbi:MAG: two-component system sensor histidine kinase NtrB [Bacillota bacterium]